MGNTCNSKANDPKNMDNYKKGKRNKKPINLASIDAETND